MEDARTRTTAPAVVREAVITAFMGAIPRHAGPPEDHKDTGDTPGGKVWQGTTPPPQHPRSPAGATSPLVGQPTMCRGFEVMGAAVASTMEEWASPTAPLGMGDASRPQIPPQMSMLF